ncbi:isoaspartyl peptidase/L-asparaginase family protein [Kordiimonas lacus]|uniref:Isoaspartyl peptidase n=1 Tax=Kordiimonas lacus TaxID=637679 RepID=A0A1G7CK69_9PROT|nr:isoaspartyl peptidase/L-asparaginase [Kordiimonas lacus]SDE39076.1 beta-aspartyl-peptidase (threonine type) [Kordiimonas lacus]
MWYKKVVAAVAIVTLGACMSETPEKPEYALVIHGGAGTITPDKLTPELEAEIRADLMAALTAGEAVLKDGGEALDAVTAAIQVMENSPHFNAGRGAVFTAEGKNEMDSSIMDGRTLDAGAVSGVRNIRNPILLARAVMEKSPHVMMQAHGAEAFAATQGIETADDTYFHTDHRWSQYEDAKAKKAGPMLDHDGKPAEGADATSSADDGLNGDYKFGTVGAVALDRDGNLAAGTSTGGMTYKMHGRVGDSPIIGAGTYANNESCAVSATGHGEYFIRATVARNICALMEYADLSLQQAADRMVMDQLVKMGGDGGIIAVDKDGNMSMTFNTLGMFRGTVSSKTEAGVAIYKD